MAAVPMQVPSDIELDSALVDAHRDGARDAFDGLCRRYRHKLVMLVFARTNDPVLAEDLAQETLLRAYESFDRFDGSRPLWPWLKRIATNLTIDHSRKAQTRVLSADPVELTDRFDRASTSDDEAMFAERQLLATALGALNPRQRVAVSLRYLHDWSPDDVAALLGLERNSAIQLLLRARRKLCKEYRRLTEDGLWGLALPILWPYYVLRDRAARWRNGGATPAPVVAAPVEAILASAASTAVAATVAMASMFSPAAALAEEAPLRLVSHVGVQNSFEAPAALVPSAPPSASGAAASRALPASAAAPSTREVGSVSVAPETPAGAESIVEARAGTVHDEDTTRILTEIEHPHPVDGAPNQSRTWIEMPCDATAVGLVCEPLDEASGSS